MAGLLVYNVRNAPTTAEEYEKLGKDTDAESAPAIPFHDQPEASNPNDVHDDANVNLDLEEGGEESAV